MAALADRSLTYARTPQVDRSGPLGGVTDWSIVEATTVKVHDARRQEFPGTGGYAAIKGHKVLSAGCGAPVRDHCGPAREHDRCHLTIDESWRGYGLLADLAYASLARLQACDTDGVHEVIRLKDRWKPKVDDLARGQVTEACFPGADLDALLEDDTLVLYGRAIDADVHVGRGKERVDARLVGVHTATGDGLFLTNLPPRMGPWQVADRYRVRVGGGTQHPVGYVGQPTGRD
jgi:DDE family transposase